MQADTKAGPAPARSPTAGASNALAGAGVLPAAAEPFIEQRRLEQAINWGRWGGAALVLGTGPAFPNLGIGYVVALALLLVAYGTVFQVLLRRVRTQAQQRRVSLVAFAADAAVVAALMLVFSPDPLWVTFMYGALVVVVGAFRIPRLGGFLAALVMSLAYLGVVALRSAEFGLHTTPDRIVTHIGLYLLTALLMTAILRELEVLRSQRASFYDPLVRAQSDLGEGLVVIDKVRPKYWNNAFGTITGRSRAELDDIGDLGELVTPEGRPRFAQALENAGTRSEPATFETRLLQRDGTARDVDISIQPFEGTDATGVEAGRVLAVIRDITTRKEAQRALERFALYDDLTGLPNRALLILRLDELLGGPSTALALILLELDGLSEVQSTFGRSATDDIHRQLAKRLAGAVPMARVTARTGDRFAAVVPAADEDESRRIARDLVARIDEGFVLKDTPLHLRARIGIALAPSHGRDAVELLGHAETALLAARAGTTVSLYADGMTEAARKRLRDLQELRTAIARDQLTLHYQPKIDAASGAVAGVEALVRWEHPQRGTVAPGEFVPVAIGTELERALSVWVLRRALVQCRAWRAAVADVPVAVNVGIGLAQDPELVPIVAGLLAETGVPARWLEIEITEDVAMTDAAQVERAIAHLDELGVRVSIDDFGVGHSSLSYLQRLRVHGIKLDRSFVTKMGTHPGDAMIVRTALELGHQLGLHVVAEGVEDADTWQQLRSLGCDAGQGYHFSRPLAILDLAAWLRSAEGGAADERALAHALERLALAEQALAAHLSGAGQAELTARLREHDDEVQLALDWAIRSGERDLALRMATALRFYWSDSGRHEVGQRFLEAILALPDDGRSPELTGLALNALGMVLAQQGKYEQAKPKMEAAVRLAREVGDPGRLATALSNLSIVLNAMGDLASAERVLEESITHFHAADDARGKRLALTNMAPLALSMGDVPRARRLAEQALEQWRAIGDLHGVAEASDTLGAIALEEGDHAAALQSYSEALRLFGQLGVIGDAAQSLAGVVILAAAAGDTARALRLVGAVRALRERFGGRRAVNEARYERTVSALLERTPPAETSEALALGSELSFESAIELAVSFEVPDRSGLPRSAR